MINEDDILRERGIYQGILTVCSRIGFSLVRILAIPKILKILLMTISAHSVIIL